MDMQFANDSTIHFEGNDSSEGIEIAYIMNDINEPELPPELPEGAEENLEIENEDAVEDLEVDDEDVEDLDAEEAEDEADALADEEDIPRSAIE